MPHTLPALPYAYDRLEPYIDAKTMEIHHSKHHQAYVDNLNKALTGTGLEEKPLKELLMNLNTVPENIRPAVRNNGGGHYNHTFFWALMKPQGSDPPGGKLAESINRKFQSFDKFQTEFTQAGLTRFGSGWAWLIKDKNGQLQITSTANQDSPIMEGLTPILGVDVWEHAYYLKYQNRRADYLKEWWNVVNWEEVEKNYNG